MILAGVSRSYRTQNPLRQCLLPISNWRHGAIGLLTVLLAISLGSGTLAVAQDLDHDGDWGEKAAREALNEHSFPWYDESADDLNSLRIDPAAPPPEATDWNLDFPEWDPTPTNRRWNWSFDFWRIVQWIIWGLLIGLLISVLGYFIRAVIRDGGFSFAGAPMADVDEPPRESERIENLPFPVERPKSDLLAEARQHYESGDFGKAIIYLFSYQLVHLDKHQWIHLAKGKTNRQYLRELGNRRSRVQGMLQQSMISFEEVFFGNHTLDRQSFEICWQQLDDFHQIVQNWVPST